MHLVWDSFVETKSRNEDETENIAKKEYNIDCGQALYIFHTRVS